MSPHLTTDGELKTNYYYIIILILIATMGDVIDRGMRHH